MVKALIALVLAVASTAQAQAQTKDTTPGALVAPVEIMQEILVQLIKLNQSIDKLQPPPTCPPSPNKSKSPTNQKKDSK